MEKEMGVVGTAGPKNSNSQLIGWLILIVPPLFWAGNFVVGRASRGDVPPMLLAFSRHFLALLCLLPFGWSRMKRDIGRYWELRWQLFRVAFAGMVAFNLLVYIGLHSTTASNAQLMNSAIPVLIVLFGAVFLRQRLSAIQGAGLLLSCSGVLVIIAQGQLSNLVAMRFSSGDVIVFCAMVSFALFSVWLRSFPADMNRVGLLGAQLVIASVILLPLVIWEYATGTRASWSETSIAAMLYVGLFPSLLANLLYMLGIARVGPARAGLFIHLVPLYGAFMSTVLLGERLHFYHAVGMIAIVAGLTCSRFGDGRPEASTVGVVRVPTSSSLD
jgi:drug/metabolite transporter (DMT)-like permease